MFFVFMLNNNIKYLQRPEYRPHGETTVRKARISAMHYLNITGIITKFCSCSKFVVKLVIFVEVIIAIIL